MKNSRFALQTDTTLSYLGLSLSLSLRARTGAWPTNKALGASVQFLQGTAADSALPGGLSANTCFLASRSPHPGPGMAALTFHHGGYLTVSLGCPSSLKETPFPKDSFRLSVMINAEVLFCSGKRLFLQCVQRKGSAICVDLHGNVGKWPCVYLYHPLLAKNIQVL